MKKKIYIFPIAIVAIFAAHIIYLSSLSPKEEFTEDSYLDSTLNQTAMILVAHRDDVIAFAGTASRLASLGWDISFVCFDGNENPQVTEELENAALISGIKYLELQDVAITKDVHLPATSGQPDPLGRMKDYFNLDSIRYAIAGAIYKYKPSVIFTLEDSAARNSDPARAAVSMCVSDVCRLFKDTVDFPVKKIYQSMLPNSTAEKLPYHTPLITGSMHSVAAPGMNEAAVAISIKGSEEKKKEVLESFASEQQEIKKLWPCYNWYPAWIYFGIFDKEFYRTIDVKSS